MHSQRRNKSPHSKTAPKNNSHSTYSKLTSSPKKIPEDLGIEVYKALKRRYLEKYGTEFYPLVDSTTSTSTILSMNRSKSLFLRSKLEQSKIEDLVELWKLRYRQVTHNERSVRITETSLTLSSPFQTSKDIEKTLMHAQKADIEFTVTKFYNIEADERKSAIGNSEEANNKAKKIKVMQQIQNKIEDIVTTYYKLKEEMRTHNETVKAILHCESSNTTSPIPPSKGTPQSSVSKNCQSTCEVNNIRKDAKFMKAFLFTYHKHMNEYGYDPAYLIKWCSSLTPTELSNLIGIAKIEKYSLVDMKNAISNYFNDSEAYIRMIKYAKINNVADSFNSPGTALIRYRIIPNIHKFLWGFGHNGFEKYIIEYTTHKVEEDKKAKEEQTKQEETKRKQAQDTLKSKIFGDKPIITHNNEELAKPMQEYGGGKALIEWKKKFPFDNIVDKMIKKEAEKGKILRFPEEYELFNKDEEILRKLEKSKRCTKSSDDNGQSKNKRINEWIQKDMNKLQSEKKAKLQSDKSVMQIYEFVKERVLEYLEQKDLGTLEEGTIKNYISNTYCDLIDSMPSQCNNMFPFNYYGLKSTNTALKAYPKSFKQYFIDVLRSFIKTADGYKKVREGKRKVIWMPSNSLNSQDKDKPLTNINEKSKNAKNKKTSIKADVSETSRVIAWMRDDTYDMKKQILMSPEDISNCKFHPNCEKLSEKSKILSNSGKDAILNPEEWVNNMGTDFKIGYPEIYKKSRLNKALLLFEKDKIEDSLKTLKEAFKLDSLYKQYDPKYEIALKKRTQMISLANISKHFDPTIITIDDQKELPEENNNNAKLIPILQSAFELLKRIDKVIWEKVTAKNETHQAINHKLIEHAKQEIKTIQDKKFPQFLETWTLYIWCNTCPYKCDVHGEYWNEKHVWACSLLDGFHNNLSEWKEYHKSQAIQFAKSKQSINHTKISEIISIIREHIERRDNTARSFSNDNRTKSKEECNNTAYQRGLNSCKKQGMSTRQLMSPSFSKK